MKDAHLRSGSNSIGIKDHKVNTPVVKVICLRSVDIRDGTRQLPRGTNRQGIGDVWIL